MMKSNPMKTSPYYETGPPSGGFVSPSFGPSNPL